MKRVQTMIPIHLVKKYQAMMSKPECSVPDAFKNDCVKEIILSHAPQKKIILAGIAENGHIMGMTGKNAKNYTILFKNEGTLVPEKIGINSASTFRGFCKFHDGKIFLPIENGSLKLTKDVAFLHCYRAVARENYLKARQTVTTKEQILDGRNMPNVMQNKIFFREWVLDSEDGARGISNIKKDYDEILSDYSMLDNFEFYVKKFKGTPRIASLGSTFPLLGYNGEKLNDFAVRPYTYHLISHAIIRTTDGFAYLWGWHKKHGEICRKFIESIRPLHHEAQNMMITLCLFENTYWRISWWEGVNQLVRDEIIEKMNYGSTQRYFKAANYRTDYDLSSYAMDSDLEFEGYNLEYD